MAVFNYTESFVPKPETAFLRAPGEAGRNGEEKFQIPRPKWQPPASRSPKWVAILADDVHLA